MHMLVLLLHRYLTRRSSDPEVIILECDSPLSCAKHYAKLDSRDGSNGMASFYISDPRDDLTQFSPFFLLLERLGIDA